ncbi:Gldg family protein [Butyricimonas hominis]|uniref:Gldg family protein n=1 Tax=Butyricimonas TaxID=574697 RepID=UPI00351832C5
MKTIYKIARTELQTLFYSPVAWLILVIFTFQASMAFTDMLGGYVRSQSLGYRLWSVTEGAFGGMRGLFTQMQQYLYLYIPLLTMGLMSRELSSGSIKLLYSSPVTNTQIILGKYLSMMIYGLVLTGILMVYMIFALFAVKSADFPAMLSGLLGLYLLLCAYAAIGLFMSSVTSYQVVAAMGTLAILAVLNYVKGMWQDIEFVRDITYWLAIGGRADEFIRGLICSEDVLYFVIVIVLFLMLSIIRLQGRRQKTLWMVTWGKYAGVVVVAMLMGFLTSRPKLMAFYDATRTKMRTLTPNSQDIVARMDGGLTITTFVNILEENYWAGLPRSVNDDLRRFRMYTRFKPEIKMKYIYYYDKAENPSLDKSYPNLSDRGRMLKRAEIWDLDSNMFMRPEEVKKIVDLKPEGNRFVRLLERDNGEKTFLRIFDDLQRFPFETEISASFKRLVMELPLVGFVKGHGERDCIREGDRDYNRFAQDKPFRHSLINQGFDFTEVTLDKPIPEKVDIIVIADMRYAMTEQEKANLGAYIARGGNLVVAGEPRRQEVMNPIVEQFGVKFLPGRLVKVSENFDPDFIIARPTKEAQDIAYIFETLYRREYVVTMPGSTALEYTEDKGFKVTPLFVSDTIGSWNEVETTDFLDDTVRLNPAAGEVERSYPTVLALSRQMGDKEQRIVILGDADCLSNGEISISRKDVPAANYYLISGSFFWLSEEEVPIDVRRPTPPDNAVNLGMNAMYYWKIVLMGLWPAILAFFAIFIWVRRRGR